MDNGKLKNRNVSCDKFGGKDLGRIRILFVITGLGTGGAEMMLFKFLSRLDRIKFSPYLISLIPGGVFEKRIKDLKIPIYSLNMSQGIPNPFALLKFKKYLNLIEPDIIQGWMYHANFLALCSKLLWNSNVPILWSIHHSVGSLKNEKISLAMLIRLTAFFSSKPNKVIFSANIGKNQHVKLGYQSVNSLAINDNFDLTVFKQFKSSICLRETLNIEKKSLLVGSLARFHPMKDHLGLLRAAVEIVRRHSFVHFVLAGPNIDSLNLELNSFIAANGLESNVHLLGEIHYVPDFLNSIELYISSSAYGESFPNVIGEAMACGVPCIATDVGDSKYIIGDAGIVVRPNNPKALCEAINKYVILGAEKLSNIGEVAKERISSNFDLDAPNSFVRKYEAIYHQMVTN